MYHIYIDMYNVHPGSVMDMIWVLIVSVFPTLA